MFHSTGCIPLTVPAMNHSAPPSKINANSGCDIDVSHHHVGSNVTLLLNYCIKSIQMKLQMCCNYE